MNNKYRTVLRVFAMQVALISLGVGTAWAGGPWFVSPSGVDGNDCLSSGTACLTIGGAIGKASSGDTINVAAGTYNENLTIAIALTLSGPNAGIDPNTGPRVPEAVINGGGLTTIIPQVPNIVINGFTILATTAGFPIYTGGADVTGLTVSNDIVGSGVRAITVATNGGNISILHNQITGDGYGIHFGTGIYSNVKINSNVVNGPVTFYAIFINGSGTITGFELKDNAVYDTTNIAANISGGTVSGNTFAAPAASGLDIQINLHNSTLSGNTFQGPAACLQLFGSQFGLVPSDTVTVSANTFTNCGAAVPSWTFGIQLSQDIQHITITNNTITNAYEAINTRVGTGWDFTGKDIHVDNNSITGSTHFAVNNSVTGTLDAGTNYWGSNLAATVAAQMSGSVSFDPWLASGTDVSVATGFQPFGYATTSGTLTTFLGTGAADTGAVLAGDPVTLMMDGDTGFVPLAQLLSVTIQLGGSDDVFTLGQTGIPTVFDGGTGNDMLVGTNVAQTWNITGAGSGNIPGAASSFTAVEALRGGTAADSFIFGAAGSIAQTIDGNLGVDTLNTSAIPGYTVTPAGPGSLDGFQGTATGIGATFDNINLITTADLTITKSHTGNFRQGDTGDTYTITVSNPGPGPTFGTVTVSDTLPAGLTPTAPIGTVNGWTCGISGQTLTCTRSDVLASAGSYPAITLTVNVANNAAAGVTNTATVSGGGESNAANDTASDPTTVAAVAGVSITKSVVGGPPFGAGANRTYTISVVNSGPGSASSVTVTDVLPAGTTFVSATPSQGSCSGTSTVTCTVGTLVNGGSATISLVLTTPSTPGTVSNTATVTAVELDLNPANNSSTSTISTVNPSSIPAASEWALIALAGMLALLGAVRART
jgi:conserved repeat domain/conserved repeat domain